MKKYKPALWFFIGVIFGYGQLWFREYLYPTPKGALPEGASNIEIISWEEGFLPDYNYSLKAEISPEQFEEYVSRLGYKFNGSSYYSDKSNDFEEEITYSNGTVNYKSQSW